MTTVPYTGGKSPAAIASATRRRGAARPWNRPIHHATVAANAAIEVMPKAAAAASNGSSASGTIATAKGSG